MKTAEFNYLLLSFAN